MNGILVSAPPEDGGAAIAKRLRRKMWPRAIPRHLRFHDLRHTTAILLLNAGVDPFAVQRIVRHTDPRITTEVYGHLVPGYRRDAINKLPLAGAADLLPARREPEEEGPFGPPVVRELPAPKGRPGPASKTSARSGLLIGCGGRI